MEMKEKFDVKSIFYTNKKNENKFIFKEDSKISFYIKDSIFFGFNGSGKTNLVSKIKNFINSINSYDLFRISYYLDISYEELKKNIKKYTLKDFEIISTIQLGNKQLHLANLNWNSKQINFFLYEENQVFLIEEFEDTWFNLFNSRNQITNEGIFSITKLNKKLNYVDNHFYMKENFLDDFINNEKNFKEIVQEQISDLFLNSSYSKEETQKLINYIDISDDEFDKFLGKVNIQNLKLKFYDKNIKKISLDFTKTIMQIIFEKVYDYKLNWNWNILNNLIKDEKGMTKILQFMFFVEKIDQAIVTDIKNNNFVQLMKFGNFMSLSMNDVHQMSLIPNLRFRLLFQKAKQKNNPNDNDKKLISMDNNFQKKLEKLEISTNYIEKKIKKIIEIKKKLFVFSGLSERFNYDFETQISTSLLGEKIRLSKGEQNIIQLINVLSNPEIVNPQKRFILVLDDPVDAVDALNKRNIIFMIKELKKALQEVTGHDVDLIKLIFTHDIVFLDDYSNIFNIKTYNHLYRDYKQNTFYIKIQQKLKFSESIEDIAYKSIKNHIQNNSQENLIPQIRIIVEWLKGLYDDDDIISIFKEEQAFITFLNRGSHFNNSPIINDIIKDWNKSIEKIIKICEEKFPKKFKYE